MNATVQRTPAGISHKRFAAGDVIVKAGETATDAYIIERGDAAAWREHAGNRTLLAQLGAGQMIGAVAVLEERHHSATVTAVSDCSVRVVTADELTRHLGSVHPVVHTLIDTLIDRLSWRNVGNASPVGLPSAPPRGVLAEHWAARRLAVQHQPIIALDDGATVGCYQHPILAIPGEAPQRIGITLADETDRNLLQSIRHWLLASACEAVADDASHQKFVGVSLRGNLACAEGLVDDVTAAIAHADIEPRQLWLVLHENELPPNTSDAWAALQTCRRAGVRLVVSEFGARLAPMAVPLRGEVDAVALAPSLIDRPHGYSALTDDINRIARDPNLHLVAIGADSERTQAVARALGCQYAASSLDLLNANSAQNAGKLPVSAETGPGDQAS